MHLPGRLIAAIGEKILSNFQKIPSKMSHCRLGGAQHWRTSKTWFYSRFAGRVNQNGKLKPLWPTDASPGRDALTSTIAPGHIWIVGIEHIWIFASGGGFNCGRGYWVNGLTTPEAELLRMWKYFCISKLEIFWHVQNILTLFTASKLCPGVVALVVGWWQNMVEGGGGQEGGEGGWVDQTRTDRIQDRVDPRSCHQLSYGTPHWTDRYPVVYRSYNMRSMCASYLPRYEWRGGSAGRGRRWKPRTTVRWKPRRWRQLRAAVQPTIISITAGPARPLICANPDGGQSRRAIIFFIPRGVARRCLGHRQGLGWSSEGLAGQAGHVKAEADSASEARGGGGRNSSR